jgi:hypothetical protein
MPWHLTLNQLRDAMAELYPDVADARRMATTAILPPNRINLQGKAVNVWHSILEQAEKQGCVEAVIAAAMREYGQNLAPVATVEAYHQSTTGEPTAKAVADPLVLNPAPRL